MTKRHTSKVTEPRYPYSNLLYGSTVADAFARAKAAQLDVQYAPEVAIYRSNAPHDTRLWEHSIVTASMLAVGTTKAGSRVEVYAHVPHTYSKPPAIREVVAQGWRSMRDGAATLPQEELERLVAHDELADDHGIRRIWVMDHDTLANATRKAMCIHEALDHPRTIPFLGSAELAEHYLRAQRRACGTPSIQVNTPLASMFNYGTRAYLLAFGNTNTHHIGECSIENTNNYVLGVTPGVQHHDRVVFHG